MFFYLTCWFVLSNVFAEEKSTLCIVSRTRNTHCVELVWAPSFLERRIYIVFSICGLSRFSVFGLSRFVNEEIYIVFSVIGLCV